MEGTILMIAVLVSLVALALVREGNLIKNRLSYRRAWLFLWLSVWLFSMYMSVSGTKLNGAS